jgi:hypothetical protein
MRAPISTVWLGSALVASVGWPCRRSVLANSSTLFVARYEKLSPYSGCEAKKPRGRWVLTRGRAEGRNAVQDKIWISRVRAATLGPRGARKIYYLLAGPSMNVNKQHS